MKTDSSPSSRFCCLTKKKKKCYACNSKGTNFGGEGEVSREGEMWLRKGLVLGIYKANLSFSVENSRIKMGKDHTMRSQLTLSHSAPPSAGSHIQLPIRCPHCHWMQQVKLGDLI